VTSPLMSRSERVSHGGTSRTLSRYVWGSIRLGSRTGRAHSSGWVGTVLAHSRTRMGEHVDRLHYKFVEGAEHID
jgi:hypothetical protein